jgi:hypothetical protein
MGRSDKDLDLDAGGEPAPRFLLARSVGIFGFKLTFSSGLANTVLIVELAGVVMLALTAWLLLKRDGVPQLKRRGRH